MTELEGIFLARPEATASEGRRLAVKDLLDTAGLTTTYGSAIFADHVPTHTAESVTRLEQAGYVDIGKTNLHEFAWGVTSANPHFGTVPNPAAPGRIAGGSSGGSAATVAAGLADLALGTDTGGSIRIPAACCGIVGFKPTYGLVPSDGCFPLAPSLDHVGPMAASVAACTEAMEALVAGFGARPLESLEELSVAVAWLDDADPLVRDMVASAAERFPRRRELELPRSTFGDVFGYEAATVHRDLFAEQGDLYGEEVAAKVERALRLTDADYERGRREREEYCARVEELLAGFDLVLTPTLAVVAPPLGAALESDALTRFTFPFNGLGWPALALPCGPAEEGLPASVQLAGRAGDDALVLAVGALLESALASPV